MKTPLTPMQEAYNWLQQAPKHVEEILMQVYSGNYITPTECAEAISDYEAAGEKEKAKSQATCFTEASAIIKLSDAFKSIGWEVTR